jgi:DNA mismatch repair protein MutS
LNKSDEQNKKQSGGTVRNLTPMMRQYLRAKESCPDSILFFRMGDFYEMFFEDAEVASKILEIALTSRDGGKAGRVPMCGVPHHAAQGYIAKLIKAGKTVAICDQVEDPKQAKGLVKREVVRTVTPGTVIEPSLLDEKQSNYLAALNILDESAGIAFLDLSTGEFLATQLDGSGTDTSLREEFVKMAPAECLYPVSVEGNRFIGELQAALPDTSFRTVDDDLFDARQARRMLLDHYELHSLKGFGLENLPITISSAGAALAYLMETQRDDIIHLKPIRVYHPKDYLVVDSATERSLELLATASEGKRSGSLLSVLDSTVTSMGGRLLKTWITHPLVDIAEIKARHESVGELLDAPQTRQTVRSVLSGVFDLERLIGRLSCATANARDMKMLGDSLGKIPELRTALSGCSSPLIGGLRDSLDDLDDVTDLISKAIVDSPPPTVTEGGIFREAYDDRLDELKSLLRDGRNWVASLQQDEIERTGITSLKVGYNKVFGYYIEVTKPNVHLVPEDYQRKQTLVNAERYVTPALKEREEEIVSAEEKMMELEYELFQQLRRDVCEQTARIQKDAEIVAQIDVLLSLADVAGSNRYCKPEISGQYSITISEGRHPVVEELGVEREFVPNDTVMDAANASLLIITGPNMAGKSTYLRQVALIVLMAQMGSFVPAKSAHIGVVDRIFTRIGASDNLVRGESTFMIEMNETASILNSATNRSLIVIDEMGRGTSTFDGISIAWAVAEYLHDRIGAKTLFATHYHELTELATKLKRAKNLNVAVREWGGKVIFLYRVVDGGADHSYGVQVARLAGLPPSVLEEARTILESLECGTFMPALGRSVPVRQLTLFPEDGESAVESELEKVDLDTMAPRDALEFLYHLKKLSEKSKKQDEP